MELFHTTTAQKRIIADTCNRSWNGNLLEAAAAIEGVFSNGRDRTVQDETLQLFTTIKDRKTQRGHPSEVLELVERRHPQPSVGTHVSDRSGLLYGHRAVVIGIGGIQAQSPRDGVSELDTFIEGGHNGSGLGIDDDFLRTVKVDE